MLRANCCAREVVDSLDRYLSLKQDAQCVWSVTVPECKLLIIEGTLASQWHTRLDFLASVMRAKRNALGGAVGSIETIDLLWDRDQLGQLTYFGIGTC